jgi:hypothetical protein
MRAGAALAVLACACNAPDYGPGHLRCADGNRPCPDNFYCAADRHCWPKGTVLDLASVATPGGPSRCAGLAVLLCDGFEAATLDRQWMVDTANGTVALDGTRAYRGAASLHLHVDASAMGTDPGALVRESRTFPIAGTAYARAWAYFQSPFPGAFNQMINFVDNQRSGVSYCIKNDFPILNAYTRPIVFKESSQHRVPVDAWTCLELQLSQTGATGEAHVFVDGDEATDAASDSVVTTTMSGLFLGLDFYANPALPAADAWIDEVIVDDKPIPCSE